MRFMVTMIHQEAELAEQAGKKNRRSIGVLAALMVGIGVAGCAGTGTGSHSVATAEPEKIVAERAAQRWDTLIKKDFSAAYTYLSPGTRQRVTQQAYADRIRGGTWKRANVESVRCEQEKCDVQIALEYGYRDMKSIETRLPENWLLQDGVWWFVPKK